MAVTRSTLLLGLALAACVLTVSAADAGAAASRAEAGVLAGVRRVLRDWGSSAFAAKMDHERRFYGRGGWDQFSETVWRTTGTGGRFPARKLLQNWRTAGGWVGGGRNSGYGMGGRWANNGITSGGWNHMGWEGPALNFGGPATGNYWATRMFRGPAIPDNFRMETSNDRRFARVTKK